MLIVSSIFAGTFSGLCLRLLAFCPPAFDEAPLESRLPAVPGVVRLERQVERLPVQPKRRSGGRGAETVGGNLRMYL